MAKERWELANEQWEKDRKVLPKTKIKPERSRTWEGILPIPFKVSGASSAKQPFCLKTFYR